MLQTRVSCTVHPRFSGPRLSGRVQQGGIQLFSLKSTRFAVEKN